MIVKSILSFIVAHIIFLTGGGQVVYKAPEEPVPNKIVIDNLSTTTQTKISTKLDGSAKVTIKPKAINKKREEILPEKTVPVIEKAPDFVAINEFARKATVNILCSTKGGELSPISATGSIVSPEGLILTNAHVAQYLLLKDYREKGFIQCVARTGSPAYPKYTIKLVYISPTWVTDNKSAIKKENIPSTGENDYAFLKISGMIDGSPAPKNILYIPMNTREAISTKEPVLLSSYPAGFLGGISIVQNLNLTTAITQIHDIFTFKSGTIDVIAVGGTVVSQKGSSGGLVVDKDSTLIGVITTSSNENSTGNRGLNAITPAYINRDLQRELGIDLATFTVQDPDTFSETFASTTGKTLTELLTKELSPN